MIMLKTAQTRKITMKSNLTPYRLENLLYEDIDDELTDHHTCNNGSLVQLNSTKKEESKYMRMEKKKAHLSWRLRYDSLIEIYLSATLDCEVILMMLLQMIPLIRSLERSTYGAV